MTAILDSTHNAMSRVFSDYMSGVPRSPKIDTKIMNLPLFYRKLYEFWFYLDQIAAILENAGHFNFLINVVFFKRETLDGNLY